MPRIPTFQTAIRLPTALLVNLDALALKWSEETSFPVGRSTVIRRLLSVALTDPKIAAVLAERAATAPEAAVLVNGISNGVTKPSRPPVAKKKAAAPKTAKTKAKKKR